MDYSKQCETCEHWYTCEFKEYYKDKECKSYKHD